MPPQFESFLERVEYLIESEMERSQERKMLTMLLLHRQTIPLVTREVLTDGREAMTQA